LEYLRDALGFVGVSVEAAVVTGAEAVVLVHGVLMGP
jgi:hypothetical protein